MSDRGPPPSVPPGPPWPPAPLRWPPEPLTDGVVVLDAMTDADADDLATACDDPEIARWIPVPAPYTPADAAEFITRQRHQAEEGTLLNFAVRTRFGGVVLGSVGAGFEVRPGEAEIGYWIARSARGGGLAARAVRLVARHVYATVGVHRIEVLVDPANTASRRTAERAGAVLEGTRRHGLLAPDAARRGLTGVEHRRDACVYSLLPDDVTG